MVNDSMRQQYLDNLTGLLIIQMIFLCHVRIIAVGITDDSFLYHIQYFLVFFMPWFFYKSGMFYTHREETRAFIKDAKKLLLPFVIYAMYAYIIQLLCIIGRHEPITVEKLLTEQINNLLSGACIPWNQPLWFLVSFFLVRTLYNIIEPFINKYIILIVSLLVAFSCRDINQYVDFWMGTTFQCLFFYTIGDVLRTIQFKKLMFISSLIVYVLRYCFTWIHEWDARINHVSEIDNYFLTTGVILAGIIMFNNIFKNYLNRRIPVLNFVGENSMLFFVTHFPCIMILHFYIMPYCGMTGSNIGFIISTFLMTSYLGAMVIAVKYISQIKQDDKRNNSIIQQRRNH